MLVPAMAGLMWLLELADAVVGTVLDANGIQPREPEGLVGVVTMPFLHGDLAHLMSNTIPFLVMGIAIALGGLLRVLGVTLIVMLVGGIGTWLAAPENTNHIGASGVVFGYAAYLVARGLFSGKLVHLGVGLVVIAVYGTTLLFGLLPSDGISWQGHLFGALGGAVAARLLDRRRRSGPERPHLAAGG